MNQFDITSAVGDADLIISLEDSGREVQSFADAGVKKRTGSSYTPECLAKFVAKHLVANMRTPSSSSISVLDPAVGEGELLVWLCEELLAKGYSRIHVAGYDTDRNALAFARRRLEGLSHGHSLEIDLSAQNFLEHATAVRPPRGQTQLFDATPPQPADIVIANPPYVRTQVLGAEFATRLADQFDLTGRVDLYHAFVLAITAAVKDGGLVGLIVSNRFMTTRAGGSVRQCLLDHYELREIWDLGDTKLFEEAVLPAVIIGERTGKSADNNAVRFSSTYSTDAEGEGAAVNSILEALETGHCGLVDTPNQRFLINSGKLDHGDTRDGVWRVATSHSDDWLAKVEAHQAYKFGDIGKIRVGVKTTADKVFIRDDWASIPDDLKPEPELLLPLITHRQSRRWCPLVTDESPRILYTHKVSAGKRVTIRLSEFPGAGRYFEHHEKVLRGRKYVADAGRAWYEIWVPQDPAAWSRPKLVFRDIAERSEFTVDLEGSVVNGDCYWICADPGVDLDLLWLALAVGNSSFVTQFYDHKFQNKLYAGRRRFMTQYVEQFPLPDPSTEIGRRLVIIAKSLHAAVLCASDTKIEPIELELDELVWKAFGLQKKS